MYTSKALWYTYLLGYYMRDFTMEILKKHIGEHEGVNQGISKIYIGESRGL